MATLTASFDRLLGPLAPHHAAHRSSPPAKRVVVFTSSGDQGRSVCASLVQDGLFIVTGITKFPYCDAAEDLRNKGCKIVKGDIADVSTYEEYLKDQDAAFVNMDFLETFHHLGPDLSSAIELETRQSIAAIEACKRAGIKHVVYSAMDDLPPEVPVPTCISKAQVVEHIKSTSLPTTFLYPSHPFSDILAWGFLTPNPSGPGLLLGIPAPDDCIIPGYAVEQVGDWVKTALDKPKKWIGQSMYACAERPTVTKMAHDLSKILKMPVDTLHLTKEEFYSEDHKANVGEAIWAMYRACYELHFDRDPTKSEKIAPRQWLFKQWATQSKVIRDIASGAQKE